MSKPESRIIHFNHRIIRPGRGRPGSLKPLNDMRGHVLCQIPQRQLFASRRPTDRIKIMGSGQFETAETFETPSVRQLSIFLEDRVGVLLRLFRIFEGSSVRVVGMSVTHANDCSILRLICDDTDTAIDLLKARGFPFIESELLVVELPHGHGLMSICSALLTGEVNISYAYPLLGTPAGRAALAIHTDNHEMAVQVLRSRKCRLLSEDDLGAGPTR